jgi:VIT1/CCC1 family predicted Fe2+/Mn2+ transporter
MTVQGNWLEEKRSEFLYHAIAAAEPAAAHKKLFTALAAAAARQAAIWEAAAAKAGETLPSVYRPDWRTKLVAALVHRLGARPLKQVLAAMKVRGLSIFSSSPLTHRMPSSIDDVGRRHRGLGSQGNLRAAVFGVSDGIVSNASLILGVAGAAPTGDAVLIAGVAGLLAGACSMAAGEYVSVRSQREMFEYQIGLEREELEHYPDEEAEELALIYEAKGLAFEAAHALARSLISDPRVALDTLAREELGLNPDELGEPFGAALASFLAFAFGAAVPLAPLLVARHGADLPLLAVTLVSGSTLFAVGACLSLFSGRNAFYGGLRLVAVGAVAGGATFALGKLLGVSLV